MMNNVLTNRLSPLIKYPGGKEKELNYIIPALPTKLIIIMSHLLVVGLYILQSTQNNII